MKIFFLHFSIFYIRGTVIWFEIKHHVEIGLAHVNQKENAVGAIAKSVRIRVDEPVECEVFSFADSESAILGATCSRDVFAQIFVKRTLPRIAEAGKTTIFRWWLLSSSSTTSFLMGSCQDLSMRGNVCGASTPSK